MTFDTRRMAQNLPRSIYWRRRAFVLGLAIGILALLAWTLNGVAGQRSQASQAGRITRVPGRVTHHRETASGPSARSSDSPAAPPAAQAQARPAPTPAPTSASALTGLPGACKPHQVVLSLVPGKGSYGLREHPQFDVYVVSVGRPECSFNVGPRYLSVVIKSGGITRIWSSADCVKGPGSDFVQLSTGVPSVLHFSWDRNASSPGCRLAGAAVRPGTYTATVTAPGDRLASPGMIFILNGPGIAVP
jgi:hypothetical protein